MDTNWLFWAGVIVSAVCGAALLAWALFSDRSRGRKRCPKCWYSMEQTPSNRCPECGHEAKREKHLHQTRRRWKLAIASMLPFALAAYLAIQPKVQRDGWASIVPMPALAICLRLEDNAWVVTEIERRLPLLPRTYYLLELPADVKRPGPVSLRILGIVSASLAIDETLARNDRQRFIRWAGYAARHVGRPGTPRYISKTIQQLADDADPMIRFVALMQMADAMDPAIAVDLLKARIEAPQGLEETNVAALGVVLLRSDLAVPVICDLFNREGTHEQIRAQVMNDLIIYATRGGRHPDMIALATSAIDDSSPEVRSRATTALLLLRLANESRKLSYELARNDDPMVRAGVVQHRRRLGVDGRSGMGDLIIEMVRREDDNWIRREAVRLHALLTWEEVFQHEDQLRESLDSDDPAAKSLAAMYLEKLDSLRDPTNKAPATR